jgi:hypothetical protein
MKNIRKKYTELNIHIEFVVNQANKEDVEGFIEWAFEELQVDSINIRRVTVDSFHSRSYLADSINAGDSLGLSDEEWSTISKKISESWSNKLSHVPSFNSHEQQLAKSAHTPVIEL